MGNKESTLPGLMTKNDSLKDRKTLSYSHSEVKMKLFRTVNIRMSNLSWNKHISIITVNDKSFTVKKLLAVFAYF